MQLRKDKNMKIAISAETTIDLTKELLNQFDIEELVLVAHSFGGRVAIKFLFTLTRGPESAKLI